MTLHEILEQQHRIITAAQADALGIDSRARARLVRQGLWERFHRGVYGVLPYDEERFLVRCRAALAFAGPDAVISHWSALRLHGLGDGFPECADDAPIHVTVPRTRRVSRVTGLGVHHTDPP